MKISTSRMAIAATAFFVLTNSNAVYAEEQAKECACNVSHDQSSQTVGSIESVKGTVYATSTKGFGVAAANQSLAVGSEIIVGADSSAKIAVGGSCALNVPASNDVKIERVNPNNICVRLTSSLTAPSNDDIVISPAQANGEEPVDQQALLQVGAWAAITGTLISCLADWCRDNKSVSP